MSNNCLTNHTRMDTHTQVAEHNNNKTKKLEFSSE